MPGEDFSLREATETDVPALERVDTSFSDEWVLQIERTGGTIEQRVGLRWRRTKPAGSRREPLFDEAEFRRSDRVIVAEREGRVAGFVMLAAWWNGTVELVSIAVDVACRRQGLGHRFLEEAESFARERSLRALHWEAQTDNRTAIEFAVSQGFRVAGFHDAFYHNEDLARQDAADFRGIALFLTKALG